MSAQELLRAKQNCHHVGGVGWYRWFVSTHIVHTASDGVFAHSLWVAHTVWERVGVRKRPCCSSGIDAGLKTNTTTYETGNLDPGAKFECLDGNVGTDNVRGGRGCEREQKVSRCVWCVVCGMVSKDASDNGEPGITTPSLAYTEFAKH